MAAKVNDLSLIPQTLGGWLGWVTAVLLAVFTARTQLKKVQVEETAAATHMWEALTTAHTAQIKALSERVAALEKAQIDSDRRHAEEIAAMRLTHADELAKRDQDIISLQRIIAQNSQSTAFRLGDPGGTAVTRANRKRRGEDQ